MAAGALHMVYQLFRNRGQRSTFQGIKQPIEQSCGRRFTVSM